MTGLEFVENINFVDDSIIFESENWVRPKKRKIKYVFGAAVAAACLCLSIGLAINYSRESNPPIEDDKPQMGGVIPGDNKIYPTIMVDGTLYEWLLGIALIDELPVGSTYYGKINHTNATTPENDCEFVSVFSASGRIFVDPNKDLVYLELTTDWLEKQLVIFEPISTSERYKYEMGIKSQE